MTEAEAAQLREWGEELAGAHASLWQPSCIARAFARQTQGAFVFRMQTWIDLEAARSPFLLGQLPEAEEAVVRFSEAFAAFGYDGTTPEACDPEGLILLGERMMEAISEGFGMRLRLSPPEGPCAEVAGDGMGSWLPVLACLVSQIGLTMAEARALPVGEAFALIAGHRINQGWTVKGETYADRDVEDEVEGRESRVESGPGGVAAPARGEGGQDHG